MCVCRGRRPPALPGTVAITVGVNAEYADIITQGGSPTAREDSPCVVVVAIVQELQSA